METGTLRIVLDPSTNLVAAHLEPEFELEHAPPPPPPLTDDETEMEALYEVAADGIIIVEGVEVPASPPPPVDDFNRNSMLEDLSEALHGMSITSLNAVRLAANLPRGYSALCFRSCT
jgi:hypothetical protein